MSVTIWHNPRCSKSRQTLALLTDRGITPTVRLYLEQPPTRDELSAVLAALSLPPSGLLRRGEAEFKALGLGGASEDDAMSAMLTHPKLIERPIVLTDKGAAIGRPPERVLEIV